MVREKKIWGAKPGHICDFEPRATPCLEARQASCSTFWRIHAAAAEKAIAWRACMMRETAPEIPVHP
jgi:hypothetical protein